jgi:tetratricopeptide (TPR) repeat protein
VADPPRRWPVVLLAVGCVLTAATGVTVGAATGTSASSSTASGLAADGLYAEAVAIDEALAGRAGPLYSLSPGAAAAAGTAAEQTVMAWAAALGRKGKVDIAVSLYRSVTDPSLRSQALDALAALLLKTATADAAGGRYPTAIQRLLEIGALAPATPAGVQAARQLPVDQAGEAGLLIASGRAADAVVILDAVLKEGSAQATRTAMSLLPTALFDAGEQALAHDSYHEALTALEQLVATFPNAAEASQAAAMLAAPQVVSGTLVTHSGAAVPGRVRLSSHYKAEPGGMYQTSAPFYYTTADAAGDFNFSGVPIGGPYVLEVFASGNWTTLINPSTNQPANPVMVTALVPVDVTFVVLPS